MWWTRQIQFMCFQFSDYSAPGRKLVFFGLLFSFFSSLWTVQNIVRRKTLLRWFSYNWLLISIVFFLSLPSLEWSHVFYISKVSSHRITYCLIMHDINSYGFQSHPLNGEERQREKKMLVVSMAGAAVRKILSKFYCLRSLMMISVRKHLNARHATLWYLNSY